MGRNVAGVEITQKQLEDLMNEYGPLALSIIGSVIDVCVEKRASPVIALMTLVEAIELSLNANRPVLPEVIETDGWDALRQRVKTIVATSAVSTKDVFIDNAPLH